MEEKESTKKQKKANDNDINEVLDELNPDYKNELIYRYLDEMPEEIVNLMKKYKNINFTKNMYREYIEKKNNIAYNGEEKEHLKLEKDHSVEEKAEHILKYLQSDFFILYKRNKTNLEEFEVDKGEQNEKASHKTSTS